jgi:hypothetical protein
MTAADYLFWSDWEPATLRTVSKSRIRSLWHDVQEGADGIHDTTEGAFPEDGIELELSPAASQVPEGGLLQVGGTCGHCSRPLSPDMALPYLIPAGEQPEGLRNIRIDMIMGELREAFTAGYVREGAAHPDVLRRAPRDFLLNVIRGSREGAGPEFCPWLDFSRAGSCKTARGKWEQGAGRACSGGAIPQEQPRAMNTRRGNPYQEPAPPRNP